LPISSEDFAPQADIQRFMPEPRIPGPPAASGKGHRFHPERRAALSQQVILFSIYGHGQPPPEQPADERLSAALLSRVIAACATARCIPRISHALRLTVSEPPAFIKVSWNRLRRAFNR
jgi:hypothetical protein